MTRPRDDMQSTETAHSASLTVWSFRACVLLLALLLGWLTIARTMSAVLGRGRPDAALAFAPWDALAKAQLVGNSQTAEHVVASRSDERLTKESLSRDPTLAIAARALAVTRAAEHRDAESMRLLLYSNRLTRRDLPTQLMLIEAFVARNDIPAVLRHFDAAASTSQSVMPVLFPILVSAIDDDQLVGPIGDMLMRQPWWLPSLLTAMAIDSKRTDNVAKLFTRLARSGSPPRADIVEILAERLKKNGDVAGANRVLELAPGGTRAADSQ